MVAEHHDLLQFHFANISTCRGEALPLNQLSADTCFSRRAGLCLPSECHGKWLLHGFAGWPPVFDSAARSFQSRLPACLVEKFAEDVSDIEKRKDNVMM